MPDEADSWLEALGVTGLTASEPDSSPAEEPGGSAFDSAIGSAVQSAADSVAEVASGSASSFAGDSDSNADAEEVVPTNIVTAPDTPATVGTVVMDNPIGVLQLISASQVDAKGNVDVTVVSSEKDALLFGASLSGTSVGTVKITQSGSTTTLENVRITAVNISRPGSTVAMTLSSRKKGRGPASPIVVMDEPIGTLALISVSAGQPTGRAFNVTVASSVKDPLLFVASTAGRSVGDVKIMRQDVLIVLRNAVISSLNISGPGSKLDMILESAKLAEISEQ